MHPRKVMDGMFTNPLHNMIIKDLLVVKQEEKSKWLGSDVGLVVTQFLLLS
jgi:hypothetical protein